MRTIARNVACFLGLFICWLRPGALQKRMNRSRYCLGIWISVGPRYHLWRSGSSPEKGQFGGLLPADCKVNGIMWRDERVEMSLGVWTRGAPGNDVSDDNAHWRHLANTLN